MEIFKHEPLESPERQIRLLEVKAAEDGGTEYHLTTHILDAAHTPYFYALSYEWGTDQPSHVLWIDGKSFKIRQNLRLFLDRIVSDTQDFVRPLWVDAICIDQERVSERNEQVKIMGRIFSAAALVLTWLGPQLSPENGSLSEIEVTLQEWKRSSQYNRLSAGEEVQNVEIISLQDPYGQMWACLQMLCRLTYWRRRWIIQELIKAGRLLFLWGNEQITWDALSAAFSAIDAKRRVDAAQRDRGQSTPMTGLWDAIASSTPFSVWQHVQNPSKKHPLLQAMETYQDSDCSVSHDKAYALTGISGDLDKVQVDYAKSLPDLYADLMALEPRTPKCLKYSKLILDALRIDRRAWDDGAVKGRTVFCTGNKIGPVIASAPIASPVTNVLIDTEIAQMSLTARAPRMGINEAIRWAQQAHEELKKAYGWNAAVTFFLLLDGNIGVATSPVGPGDLVYTVKGASEESEPLQLCQAVSEGRARSVSSPRASVTSISRESLHVSLVWLSGHGSTSFQDQQRMTDSIEISLEDLYDMNDKLGWTVGGNSPLPTPTEPPSSPHFMFRKTQSDTMEFRQHRASTVSDSTEATSAYKLRSAFTWSAGTSTDGTSKLNTPE